jgi:hypothetical protein
MTSSLSHHTMPSPEPHENGFGLEPRWSVEPDIETIKQTTQSIRPSSTAEAAFFEQGAFNKLYDVRINEETLIMRVSLPVDSWYKSMSKVAAVDWVHSTTNLPVPRIVAPREEYIVGGKLIDPQQDIQLMYS